jgi:RNA polymerase sigma-70 factor (ECF subfamily)
MASRESNENADRRTIEFLRLLGEHERSLYALILAMVANWSDADDLIQETRIRLWQQFDKYRPGTDFGAWARSIAYYLVLAHRERASRNPVKFGQQFYAAIAAEAAATPTLVNVRQQALLRCLENLDSSKRRLLEQYCLGKESLRRLAERLSRSYDATRKAVYRTQLALGDCVNEQLRKERGE